MSPIRIKAAPGSAAHRYAPLLAKMAACTSLIIAQSLVPMGDLGLNNGALARSDAAKADALPSKIGRLPVKEVTIFKDGHALLIHEGQLPTTDKGEVLLDELPQPLLGTFFPYSLEPGARLKAATTGRRKVNIARTALAINELVAANAGAAVRVDELIGEGNNAHLISYDATIIGIPQRSAEELADTGAGHGDAGSLLPERSSLVELKTDHGNSFVPINRIQTISFKDSPRSKVKEQELRDLMTLSLDWRDSEPKATANVGMMYVEKGLRWIPSYKVSIDGQNHARVKLQATLVNDLTDLNDVNANLVVGVPSFAFSGEVDAIALSQSIAAVASMANRDSRLRNSFSNAILLQSQTVGGSINEQTEAPTDNSTTGSKSEDLYVFSIKHLSLKKGERMVVPVQEYLVDYKDLYTLDLAMVPPPEVQSQLRGNREDLDKAAVANKVVHKIRLTNTSKQPFTTAPALVTLNTAGKNEVLAQGMMTYASVGSDSELTLNPAVDIRARKNEKETARVADAVTWQDYKYARINLSGKISVTNFMDKPITLEVNRQVLGRLDSAGDGGKMEMVNALDEMQHSQLPYWWSYYSWPGWWQYMNGIGKFTWTRTLEPGKSIDLDYNWHYFWR